ncbi:hypothetical protein [Streptomyces mirabilis]|uniref:hypothetical protein n=1 Tax=Streptomyces mirabilis TaxID=68239 RepID=UPI0037218923
MPAPRRNRFEPCRAEAYQAYRALVRAARPILTESGGTRSGIHAIAERADVGLGSF